MSTNTRLTYYQKNRDIILSKAEVITKTIKIDYLNRQEINTTSYLNKKKIKKENIEEMDITT